MTRGALSVTMWKEKIRKAKAADVKQKRTQKIQERTPQEILAEMEQHRISTVLKLLVANITYFFK